MLSLVTLAKNRRPQLRNLLAAAAIARPAPFEVVVVDMGGERIDGWPPELRVRVVDLPTGPDELPLAAARNLGAEVAAGTMLAFLDVDCMPGADLFGELRAGLHRRGGLVMANVNYLPEGFVDDGCEATRLAAGAPHPTQAHLDQFVPKELFWSTAFGVCAHTFHELGGFDEAFTGYGAEDTDLGFRAAAAGMPISRWRTALAHHQWHPSPDPPLQHLEDIVRNATTFRERWGVWPMEGWLAAFARLDLVEWDPTGDHLVLTDAAVPV